MVENPRLRIARSRIENAFPAQIATVCAEVKRNALMTGIKQDGEGIADDSFASLVGLSDLISGKRHSDASGMSRVPVGLGHLAAIRLQPVEILNLGAVDRP